MKMLTLSCNSRVGQSGITLVEMLVTMAISGIVILGCVYTQYFGMRQDQLVQSKLGASFYSRKALDDMTSDIRSAVTWQVGTGTSSSFTPVATNAVQSGNALQLFLTPATNTYICYYFDTSNQQLMRWKSGVTGNQVIANYLTNTMTFTAEDYLGNVASTRSYKNVIHVILQFWQYQYPTTRVGPNNYYNYYKMEFKVTPHCPSWP